MFIRERTRFRIPPLNAKKSPAVAELFAEREGFEPPVPLGTVVFKTTVCGERGIRTPGTSRYGSFQDYCNRPLYHLSSALIVSKAGAKVTSFLQLTKF